MANFPSLSYRSAAAIAPVEEVQIKRIDLPVRQTIEWARRSRIGPNLIQSKQQIFFLFGFRSNLLILFLDFLLKNEATGLTSYFIFSVSSIGGEIEKHRENQRCYYVQPTKKERRTVSVRRRIGFVCPDCRTPGNLGPVANVLS